MYGSLFLVSCLVGFVPVWIAFEQRYCFCDFWAVPRQFAPYRVAICLARCSCGTVCAFWGSFLSREMLLWDSLCLLGQRFVPRDALVGQFAPFGAAFCPARCSCGTVCAFWGSVLSREMLLWDSLLLLGQRFVPNQTSFAKQCCFFNESLTEPILRLREVWIGRRFCKP
jgi:hypothetical protein